MRKLLCFALFVWAAAAQMPDWATIQANIPYDQYKETVLDILQPTAPSKGKRPGVIAIQGGGWPGGTKESRVQPIGLRYVEKGFVVANVEYRLAKAALAPAAVTDALKGAEWFRQHARQYNVDKNRIVVTGGSAGGHLALMVGMTPKSAHLGPVSPIAAVVDGYGITDAVELLAGPHHQSWDTDWIPEGPVRVELAQKV